MPHRVGKASSAFFGEGEPVPEEGVFLREGTLRQRKKGGTYFFLPEAEKNACQGE